MTSKKMEDLIYSCSDFWDNQDLEDDYTIDPMMLNIWSDPEITGELITGGENPKLSERLKKKYTKERKERQREIMRERWKNPEFRDFMKEIQSTNMAHVWENPDFKYRMLKMFKSQEFREKTSNRAKKMWNNPDYRESMSGENNPNWRGGISKEPYPFEFNEKLKKMIRERDGNRCTSCGSSRRLAVHHINYIKEDLRPENLITLCPTCHGKAHWDREDWDGGLRNFHKKAKVEYYLTDIKTGEVQIMGDIILDIKKKERGPVKKDLNYLTDRAMEG